MVDSRLRLQVGLLALAALLVGATAMRGARLLRATPDTSVVVRAVEAPSMRRPLLVAQDGDAWTVRAVGRDEDRRVRPGQVVEVGGASVQVVEGTVGGGDEVLRLPWTVFGSRRGGHFRIDFGADPLGLGDGVRDRVVLPETEHGAAWFRLVPDGERSFGPADRGGWVVAERPGLTVRSGGVDATPEVGEPVRVDGAFDVLAEDVDLTVAWVSVRRASVLEGADGRVIGYGEGRDGVDFVVRSRSGSTSGPPQLVLLDRAGEPLDRVLLSEDSPTLVHGPRGRLTARGGHVLPPTMRDLRLEEAVRDGLEEGWIEVGARGASVTVPGDEDGPRNDLGWGLARDVVEVVERYDRAARPRGLRLLTGVDASASSAGSAPLRFDGGLQAFVPSAWPEGEVEFALSVDGPEVRVAAAAPGRWRVEGAERWRALPPPREGRWIEWALDVGDAERVELRLEGAIAAEPVDVLSFAVAGAPERTWLAAEDVRVGVKAYDRWQDRGFGGPARSLWRRVEGDRWSAEDEAPALRSSPRVAFVRVPLDAATPGWLALDLAVPGRVLRAWWNGSAHEDPRLPTQAEGGRARLSLPTRTGANLLALQIELPGTVPALQAGAVRFHPDVEGRPAALDASVARRRMREAVRTERRRERARSRAGAPYVVVERGTAGLPTGTRWRLAASSDVRAASVLVLAERAGEVRRNDLGSLRLGRDGLAWHNGDRLALSAVRPPREDPSGLPSAGHRLLPGARQPLKRAGESVVAESFRLRTLPSSEDVVRGGLVVVYEGQVHSLQASGAPRWHRDLLAPPLGPRVVVRAEGLDVQVAVDRPASLWTRDGRRVPLAANQLDAADVPTDGFSPWPPGARLVLDGKPLRLLRPGDPEPHDVPAWAEQDASTFDPDLQEAALWALRSQLTDVAEDTESLAGALLVLDARTGDILACASHERAGGDPASRLHRPCWQDGGFHPGSTFKVATASAALASPDPAVRRMLDGQLPAPLVADGPRASLRGAKLPGLGGAKVRSLRSRLRNFRGRPMRTDTDLEGALRSSLNTWFGYVGLLMHRPTREGWGGAGIARQEEREEAWPVSRIARAAGFSRRMALGGGEFGTGGSVPAVAASSDAQVAARSVGQGEVTATPLGVAGLLSVAANGGEVARPRVTTDRAVARRSVLAPAPARRLAEALGAVVRKGTASRAFADNPRRDRILGKTGSAQRIDRHGVERSDAWFGAAILPPDGVDDSPIIAVALLPGAGLGGGRAAEAIDQFSRDLSAARGW